MKKRTNYYQNLKDAFNGRRRVGYLLVLLAFAFVLSACSSSDNVIPEEEKEEEDVPFTTHTVDFDGGSVTYQYKEGTKVIDESNQAYLIKIESDTIIYFSKDIPAKLKPGVGTIYSCGLINEKIPYGLGNKVLSLAEENGMYKCITTSAPLNEIFEDLKLSADIQLITDTISEPIEDVNGNLYEVNVSKDNESRTSVSSSNILTIQLGYRTSESRGAFANGAVSLGAIGTIEIDIKENKSECSLSLYTGLDVLFGTKASVEKEYTKFFPRKGKHTLVQGRMAFGPVVVRPYIDIEAGWTAGLEGSITSGLHKKYGVKLGVRNGKGFIENLTQPGSNLINSLSVDATGEMAIVAKIDFGAGLYTKNVALGIETSVKASLSTDFKLNNNNLFRDHPNLDFNLTVDADAYFLVQFLDKELVHGQANFASFNLFSHSWPLLPSYKESSLKINPRTGTWPLVYDAEYSLTGGLLNVGGITSELLSIKPSFIVYKDDEEVYHIVDEQSIDGPMEQKFTFELDGLEDGIVYVGKPCIIIGDKIYEEDGKSFPLVCADDNHPHPVDLGLPSGTLWCCVNVGASSPADFGDYYSQVGAYDAVKSEMGDDYDLPTRAQFEELVAHTTQEGDIKRNGMWFKGKNGASIFLPAAAQLYKDEDGRWCINNEGSGAYWTSTKSHNEGYGYFLEFDPEEDDAYFGDRKRNNTKMTIRPVCRK